MLTVVAVLILAVLVVIARQLQVLVVFVVREDARRANREAQRQARRAENQTTSARPRRAPGTRTWRVTTPKIDLEAELRADAAPAEGVR